MQSKTTDQQAPACPSQSFFVRFCTFHVRHLAPHVLCFAVRNCDASCYRDSHITTKLRPSLHAPIDHGTPAIPSPLPLDFKFQPTHSIIVYCRRAPSSSSSHHYGTVLRKKSERRMRKHKIHKQATNEREHEQAQSKAVQSKANARQCNSRIHHAANLCVSQRCRECTHAPPSIGTKRRSFKARYERVEPNPLCQVFQLHWDSGRAQRRQRPVPRR